jgi:hypothetical protein
MIAKELFLTNEWIDVYTELGITNTSDVFIQNKSAGPVFVWPKDSLPISDMDGAHLSIGENITTNAAGEKLYIKGRGNVFVSQITTAPVNVTLPPEAFTINVGATVGVSNTDANAVPIRFGAVVSANNSTIVQLASNQTFTGVADEVTQFGTILIAVHSNGASAQNGLKFQTSNDQVSWYSLEEYTFSGPGVSVYSMSPGGKYFRITYTNGGAATAGFYIHTTYKQGYVKPSSHRVGDNITGENDAELVKAVLTAEMPNGNYTNINSTAGGNLKVSMEEFDPGFGYLPVEASGRPTVARNTASTTASTNIVLTASVRRIAIYARTADIRFKLGTGAQTANAATDHYLPKATRVVFAVPTNANIAVIREALETVNGLVEITELV